MPHRICPTCRRRFHATNHESRCPECAIPKAPRLATREPWRVLYKTIEWRSARRLVLERDRYQCRALVAPGRRCRIRTHLQVHHHPKLRDLWTRASCFDEFVELACSPRHLVTLCPEHHAQADHPSGG